MEEIECVLCKTYSHSVLSVIAIMLPLPSVCLWHVAHASAWAFLYSLSSRIVKVGYPKGGSHHAGGVYRILDLPYHLMVCSCLIRAYVGSCTEVGSSRIGPMLPPL